MRICDKFKRTAKTGEFFSLHEWDFHVENQKMLSLDLPAKERAEFLTDVSSLFWDDYIKQYMLGIRKYVLMDSVETLPSAKQKLQRLAPILNNLLYIYGD